MTKIWSSRHLPKFSHIRSTKFRTKFDYIQLSRVWLKIGHIQSSRSRPTNLVESTLTEIWLIRTWPKCGHIWPSQPWPKFGRIRKIGRGQNSVESSQVDLNWNFFESTLAQIWSRRPRPKFVWKSSKFIPCWYLASLASTKNLSNSMVSTLSKI